VDIEPTTVSVETSISFADFGGSARVELKIVQMERKIVKVEKN